MDSNWLNLVFNGNDIAFFNPKCKKENSPKLVKDTADFSQIDISSMQVVALSGYCTPLFQFHIFSWEVNNPNPVPDVNSFFTSRLSYRYLENVSPPPRFI
ncbi:hypothetical protein ACJRPK_04980 [Aquimarina sp. 2-A2]|uniref:hypothetical protein n=1 Tax=Aquimarina sp. 2-A2 TaxID=3382644 RepID=UPI00387F368E